MPKKRRNTETVPQSKRHQGTNTEQQLVGLDSNQSLPYRAGLPDLTRELMQTACDPDVATPKDQKLDVIEIDQNLEEEDNVGMSLGLLTLKKTSISPAAIWMAANDGYVSFLGVSAESRPYYARTQEGLRSENFSDQPPYGSVF
jgi:hypothetical protein